MKTYDFKSYMSNLNRVRFVELIDNCQAEMRMNSFRASLIVNPVTGLPYDAPSTGGLTPGHAAAV